MIVSAGPAGAEKAKYRRWLNEEVYWLITREEADAFKKLKTDKERDHFIAVFWARRDPSALTEKNEFKDAHYSRLDYVNRKYTRAQDMGWKTDAGKILLFFGLPRERKSNPETWFYDPMPFLKIEEEFSVVFDLDETAGLVLNQKWTSETALRAMDDYAARTLFNPGLTEIPDYRRLKATADVSEERRILDRVSGEGAVRADIPLETAFYFSKAEARKTSLSIVYFLDPGEKTIKEAVLFARFRAEGRNPEDFYRAVKVKEDDYYLESRIPLLPGAVQGIFGLRDLKSGRYSVVTKDLEIPDFWTGQLRIGNLVITDRVETVSPDALPGSGFDFGQYFAFPKKERVFHKTDTLNVVFQVYNAGEDGGRIRLVQDIRLISQAKTYKLPEVPLENEVPPGRAAVAGIPIPLTQIEPGEYELRLKITDRISGQVAEETVKVTIID